MPDIIRARREQHRKTMPAVLFFVGITFLIIMPGLIDFNNSKETSLYIFTGIVVATASLAMIVADNHTEKYALSYLALLLVHLFVYSSIYTGG